LIGRAPLALAFGAFALAAFELVAFALGAGALCAIAFSARVFTADALDAFPRAALAGLPGRAGLAKARVVFAGLLPADFALGVFFAMRGASG
jgi:hypothetical protein